MHKKQQLKALEIILELVNGNGFSKTPPVKLSIGHVDKDSFCNSDSLVLLWANDNVIRKLRQAGYVLTLTENGLEIDHLGECD